MKLQERIVVSVRLKLGWIQVIERSRAHGERGIEIAISKAWKKYPHTTQIEARRLA